MNINNYSPQLYDVVDDHDLVIGQATKTELHQKGLLHRGINVLFYTKSGMVILQKRSADKNTFPGKLDVTVAGHVDSGDTYESAAIKEILEETGLNLQINNLTFISKFRRSNEDTVTDTVSNFFCVVYVYCFEGELSDLQVETNKATGFINKPLGEVINASPENSGEFSPSICKEDYKAIWLKLKTLINNS